MPDAQGPLPTAEARMQDWATLPEGASVPVSIAFGRALPDSAVAALLDRYELRPYAVYLSAAGMTSSQRRERSRASLEVLAEAREQAIAQLRTSLCAQQGRARSMLAEAQGGADPVPVYREVLSGFLLIQRTLPELQLGAPLIYGIEAVGGLEGVRAAGSDGTITAYEPGWRGTIAGVDTVVVPQPPAPSGGPPPVDDETAGLTPEQVRARMAQLAENGMGSCEDASRPDTDGR